MIVDYLRNCTNLLMPFHSHAMATGGPSRGDGGGSSSGDEWFDASSQPAPQLSEQPDPQQHEQPADERRRQIESVIANYDPE